MRTTLFFFCFILLSHSSYSQYESNFDESKVPAFDVPDPLISFAGKKIRNKREWEKIRRPELLEFFTENMYGRVPGKLGVSSYKVIEQSDFALSGKARRKQVEIVIEKNGHSLKFNILIYLPQNVKRVPLFIGYNFHGNSTITNDTNVFISNAWVKNNETLGITNNQLTEKSRGVSMNNWPVEKIIDAGYGLATIYYGEIDPDKNDFTDGIHPFFYTVGQKHPAANEWGSIAAWAWGMRRAMDYFVNDNDINKSKIIIFSHSRLGKTALWVGATDKRFAAVISNNSGSGGASLSKRKFGQEIGTFSYKQPHWFCKKFNNYNNNEIALPVDQHELIALIAPRPVYIASAEDDLWADPLGEFLSAHYASSVYALYDKKGISSKELPKVNQPIHNTVAYHIRSGKHDVTDYDWEQYLKWANTILKIK